MTHSGPMPESAGDFSPRNMEQRPCRKCAAITEHTCQAWDSSDGAYTDHKYRCRVCETVHWVDGIDS